MKRAILTGPTGGIGTALTEVLCSHGVETYAVCRPGSPRIARLAPDPLVHIVECDISEYPSLEGKLPAADAFFHFGWEKTTVQGRDDLDCQLNNVKYSLDAVRLAKACGCTVFVGAGSQAEYGIAKGPLSGDTPAFPESGYGIAKYAAGRFTRNLCAQLGLRHCWVRVLSAYGRNDGEGTLISYLVRTLREGGVPKLTPCGQVWDYIHFTDAARAFFAVAERGKDGRTYCLGSGSPRPLKEYAEELRDCVAPGAELQFGALPYYPHQPMYLAADIRELSEDTGWRPEKSFREGIEEILHPPAEADEKKRKRLTDEVRNE